MNLYDFINELSALAEDTDIIVPSSSGFASEITQQAWKVKQGQRIICNPGLGSMGFALPHAIGVSVASNRRVLVIEGDGSLQHNIQELATISRLNLNIKIFVINNNGYASIRNTHKKYFDNNPVSDLWFPNLSNLTKAYDIQYSRIYNKEHISCDKPLIDSNYPTLHEVYINPDQKKVNV